MYRFHFFHQLNLEQEIPPELSDKIRTVYKLNADASDALLKAECETLHKSISISMGAYEDNEEFKKAAISISRDLQELPVNEVQKLQLIFIKSSVQTR